MELEWVNIKITVLAKMWEGGRNAFMLFWEIRYDREPLCHAKALRLPQRPVCNPEPAFVAWHVREVLEGEARCGVEMIPR